VAGMYEHHRTGRAAAEGFSPTSPRTPTGLDQSHEDGANRGHFPLVDECRPPHTCKTVHAQG